MYVHPPPPLVNHSGYSISVVRRNYVIEMVTSSSKPSHVIPMSGFCTMLDTILSLFDPLMSLDFLQMTITARMCCIMAGDRSLPSVVTGPRCQGQYRMQFI